MKSAMAAAFAAPPHDRARPQAPSPQARLHAVEITRFRRAVSLRERKDDVRRRL
jgi:hypothetical protein